MILAGHTGDSAVLATRSCRASRQIIPPKNAMIVVTVLLAQARILRSGTALRLSRMRGEGNHRRSPDPSHISRSYVECQNLTMHVDAPVYAPDERLQQESREPRRSRSPILHDYNFGRVHQTLRGHACD